MKARRKTKSFYIDTPKAERLGLLRHVTITLNGAPIRCALAAKSGPQGFVVFHPEPVRLNHRRDELITVKKAWRRKD